MNILEGAINALAKNGIKGADAVIPLLGNQGPVTCEYAYTYCAVQGKNACHTCHTQKIADHLWLPDGLDALTAIGSDVCQFLKRN